MSSILLTNPFVTAPAPMQGALDYAPAQPLAPPPSSGASTAANDGRSFAGSRGSGTSNQAQNAALLRSASASSFARPSDATRTSVVNAQALDATQMPPSLPGDGLPEVDMPLPLPTSPFLLDR